ncbi:hypothetical protein ACFW16_10065 [Inquilinus sp. NPDC058860]|uniref:hypothetical protein n=1 Tax=Inquilinus sp. NPDC058860 TaxID=3346652 RepID=UPI0036984606
MLSELAGLAMELARGFQAQGVAALAASDLDRAGKAETRFSSLFLGIRRAVALKARLRQQREERRHKAEARRDRLQDRKDDRRHAVAQGVSHAIAVVSPDAMERLTADLWIRLTENERIDADLGLPGDTIYNFNTTTGEVFAPGGKLFRKLPMDEAPSALADTGPPSATAPPDPAPDRPLPAGRRQWTDDDWAEHRRREKERDAKWRGLQMLAHIHRHG